MGHLAERVARAKMAAEFAVVTKNKAGQVKKVDLPGHDGKRYMVIVKRTSDGIHTDCYVATRQIGSVPCKGNEHATCYHTLAAVVVAAKQMNGEVRFAETEIAADKLARFGGKVVKVEGNGHPVWAVFFTTAEPVASEPVNKALGLPGNVPPTVKRTSRMYK